MKKLLSLASLVMCGILLLSACGAGNGGGDDTAGQGGRYIQTDITPPGLDGQPIEALRDGEGKLIVYSRGLAKRFESADGGATWDEQPGPGTNAPALQYVDTLSLGEDGALYGVKHAADGFSSDEIVKIFPDGALENLAVPDFAAAKAEGKNLHVRTLRVLPQNRLLLSYMRNGGAVEQAEEQDNAALSGDAFDAAKDLVSGLVDLSTGKLVGAPLGWMGTGVANDDEQVYLLEMDGTILTHSLNDGAKVDNSYGAGPATGVGSMPTIHLDADGTLYTAGPASFLSLDKQGATGEVMNPSSFAFGNPNGTVKALFKTGDESYVLSYELDGAGRLYDYTYDADATTDPAKTLNIWSLHNNPLVRAAISRFLTDNPDALINYDVALGDDENDEGAINDAINTLNTELLAGKGPDILLLDDLPAENYAAKNMLKDLSSLVDIASVYEKLLSGFEQDGKLYMVPTRFSVPLLVGNGGTMEAAGTLEKLVALAEAGPDDPGASVEAGDPFAALPEGEQPVLNLYWDELVQMLWSSSASKIIADNKVDEAQLRALLDAMKRLSDKYRLTDVVEGLTGSMMIMTEGGNPLSGSPIAYMMDRARYGALNLESFGLYDAIWREGIEDIPFPGLSQGAWQPKGLAGINANTANPEFAAAFIQTLLSDEVQSALASGIPVTDVGAQAHIRRLDEGSKEDGGPGFAFDMPTLLEALGEPVFSDAAVKSKVMAVAGSYCRGEIDLDSAIGKIQQDLKNYLAERN